MSRQLSTHINNLLADEIDIAIRGRVRAILTHLDIKKGDVILDAGCGWGYYLRLITKLPNSGYQLVGVDLDKPSIQKAKKAVNQANVKLVVADLGKLPFKDASFNKIIMSEVAEHLPNDMEVLKELYRVLKPNGVLLLTVPNHNYPLFWDPVNWILEHTTGNHIKSGFWAGIWTNHLRLYTPKQITNKLKKVGFKVEKVQSLTLITLPFNKNLLYGGKLPPRMSKQFMSAIKSYNKPLYIKVMLLFVNINDTLNQLIWTKNIGVSVFVMASKSYGKKA